MTGLSLYLAIATLTWSNQATPADPIVAADKLCPHDSITATYKDLQPYAILGKADFDNCQIEVDIQSISRGQVCTTVVHEFGHLIGLRHSSDPSNVMYTTYIRPYWRCTRKWRAIYAETLDPLQ